LLFIVVYSFLQERRHAFYVEKKLARNLCGLAGPIASATCQQNLLIYSLSFYTLRDEESTRATLKLNPNRRLWARTTPCGAGLPLTIRLTWRPRRQDKTAFCSAGCAHCHTRPRRQRAGFFMNSSASDVDVSTPLTRSRHERSKRDCARHPGLDQHFKNLRGIGRFFFRKSADSTGSNFVIWSFLLNTNRSKSDSTLLEFFSPVVSLTLLRTACFVTQIASPPVGSARSMVNTTSDDEITITSWCLATTSWLPCQSVRHTDANPASNLEKLFRFEGSFGGVGWGLKERCVGVPISKPIILELILSLLLIAILV
jgi:hypothetical protein